MPAPIEYPPIDSDAFLAIMATKWREAPLAITYGPDGEVIPTVISPTDVPILVQHHDGTDCIIHVDRAVVWRLVDSLGKLPQVAQVTFADHEWDGHERAHTCQGECRNHGV